MGAPPSLATCSHFPARFVGWTTPLGEVVSAPALEGSVDRCAGCAFLSTSERSRRFAIRCLPLLIDEIRAPRRRLSVTRFNEETSGPETTCAATVRKFLTEIQDLLATAIVVSIRRARDLADAIEARWDSARARWPRAPASVFFRHRGAGRDDRIVRRVSRGATSLTCNTFASAALLCRFWESVSAPHLSDSRSTRMGLRAPCSTRPPDLGVTFLDTADVPTRRRPHHRGAHWRRSPAGGYKGKRGDHIVASKCFLPMGRNRWDMGNSRRHIMDAIDASLRRLQTDFIDLYQLHFDDPGVPLDETISALDDLVRAGKVRYIGCSNFLAYRLARALGRSEALGPACFVPCKLRHNLLFREARARAVPALPRRGHRGDPVQPDRRWPALGQARPVEAARRGDALHARQRGRDVPRPLLARQRVRHLGRRSREDRVQRRGIPP